MPRFRIARFVKIRHYGLLANRGRQARLQRARVLLGAEPLPVATADSQRPRLKTKLPTCPHCGWAALFLVRIIPPQRFVPAPAVTDSS